MAGRKEEIFQTTYGVFLVFIILTAIVAIGDIVTFADNSTKSAEAFHYMAYIVLVLSIVMGMAVVYTLSREPVERVDGDFSWLWNIRVFTNDPSKKPSNNPYEDYTNSDYMSK